MSVAQLIAVLAIAAGCFVLACLVYDRRGGDAFWRQYDAAQLQDLEYARTHPGCSYEEAHRERDRVMRRFGRY